MLGSWLLVVVINMGRERLQLGEFIVCKLKKINQGRDAVFTYTANPILLSEVLCPN